MADKLELLSPIDITMAIRGLAILGVVGYHVRYVPVRAIFLEKNIGDIGIFNGISAVWILLVLSGYAQGKRYFSNETPLIAQTGRYYVRRIVKIFPLYFLVLAITWFVFRLYDRYPLSLLIQLITFQGSGTGHLPIVGNLWMISVLVPLYALTPFVASLFHRIRSWRVASLIPPAILVWGFMLRFFVARTLPPDTYGDWSSRMYAPLLFTADIYFFGLSLSYAIRQPDTHIIKNDMTVYKQRIQELLLWIIIIVLFTVPTMIHTLFLSDVSGVLLPFAVYLPIGIMMSM